MDFTVPGLPPPVSPVTRGHRPQHGLRACTSVSSDQGTPFTPWCVYIHHCGPVTRGHRPQHGLCACPSVSSNPGDTVHTLVCVRCGPTTRGRRPHRGLCANSTTAQGRSCLWLTWGCWEEPQALPGPPGSSLHEAGSLWEANF